MVSNLIKLSLGSLFFFVILACANKSENNKKFSKKKKQLIPVNIIDPTQVK